MKNQFKLVISAMLIGLTGTVAAEGKAYDESNFNNGVAYSQAARTQEVQNANDVMDEESFANFNRTFELYTNR